MLEGLVFLCPTCCSSMEQDVSSISSVDVVSHRRSDTNAF